jgi:hypothetical protein
MELSLGASSMCRQRSDGTLLKFFTLWHLRFAPFPPVGSLVVGSACQ